MKLSLNGLLADLEDGTTDRTPLSSARPTQRGHDLVWKYWLDYLPRINEPTLTPVIGVMKAFFTMLAKERRGQLGDRLSVSSLIEYSVRFKAIYQRKHDTDMGSIRELQTRRKPYERPTNHIETKAGLRRLRPLQSSIFLPYESTKPIETVAILRHLRSESNPLFPRSSFDPSNITSIQALNIESKSQSEENDIVLQPEMAYAEPIFYRLVKLEQECIESLHEKASKGTLDTKQWRALIALHRSLLDEHHDFFLVSQRPSASPALRLLASEYSMPARLTAITESDIIDKEVWTGVVHYWYLKASGKAPTTGRLHHHLAILARPNTLQQRTDSMIFPSSASYDL
ncbi:hypothetical protein BPOR_0671g00010 [Botrytis porri]|uniref:Uncharacterized protein n=1 Tax=Botrytis porri TaxID=87229 RepID=A0A4Z1KAW1_9HELO|nr:hypothetical protein BPOR_0671g00010 [Botrytis porri]